MWGIEKVKTFVAYSFKVPASIHRMYIDTLAYFFRSHPLFIYKNPQKYLFSPSQFVAVLTFERDPCHANGELREDTDERVVRRALSWIGKMRFAEFGLNGMPSAPQQPLTRKELTALRVKRWQRWISNVGWAAAQPPLVHLDDCSQRANAIAETWLTSGRLPTEISDCFTDGSEDAERLYGMVGRQTYKVHRNKGFGTESQELLTRYAGQVKESLCTLAKYWEDYFKRPKRTILGVEDLIGIISLPACSVTAKVELVEQATQSLANAAYDIRLRYPKRGWEVRTGLVHESDYRELADLACRCADEKIVKRILANGCAGYEDETGYWEPEEEGDVRFVVAAALMRNTPNPPHITFLEPAAYTLIGKARYKEFAEQGHTPYLREATVIKKILRLNLNKKQFRNAVNNWLTNNAHTPIDWGNLKFEKPIHKIDVTEENVPF